MNIVKCQHCGAKFDVTKMTPGTKIKCGRCKEVFTVPAPAVGDVSEFRTMAMPRPAELEEEADPAPAPVAKRPATKAPPSKSAASPKPAARPATRANAQRAPARASSAGARPASRPPATSAKTATAIRPKPASRAPKEEVPGRDARTSRSGARVATNQKNQKLIFAASAGALLIVAAIAWAFIPKDSPATGNQPDGGGTATDQVAGYAGKKAKTDFKNAEAVMQLAHWCDLEGLLAERDENLQIAHDLSPTNANVNAKIDEVYAKKREVLKPDSQQYWDLVQWLDRMGRKDEADKVADLLVKKINKHHADANRRFGRVLYEGSWEDKDLVDDVVATRAAIKSEEDLLASMSPRQKEVYKIVQRVKKEAGEVEFEYLDTGNDQKPYLLFVQKSKRYAAESCLSEFAEVLTHLYDLFYEQYGQRFDFADLKEEIMVVWVYEDARTYGARTGAPPFARGHYSPQNHEVATYNESSQRYEVIFHEGVHQMVHRLTMKKGGKDGNMFWFTEGLATYFETFKRDKNLKFILGEVASGSWLPNIKAAVRAKKHVPLETFVSWVYGQAMAQPPEVIGGLLYPEAWAFMHFLYNFENAKYRAKFEEYFLKEIQGQGGPEAFTAIFGDIKAIEQEWVGYVTSLK